MLIAGVDLMAEELCRYGEDATAHRILTCSNDELLRVCSVAGWLLVHGPNIKLYATAEALAAVYVHEGRPRDLARTRRVPGHYEHAPPDGGRKPSFDQVAGIPDGYCVGDDVRGYWSTNVN